MIKNYLTEKKNKGKQEYFSVLNVGTIIHKIAVVLTAG